MTCKNNCAGCKCTPPENTSNNVQFGIGQNILDNSLTKEEFERALEILRNRVPKDENDI